jgi:hypothetical protein
MITDKQGLNTLLIVLSIWVGSLEANEPLQTKQTPNIIIANEMNELDIRDIEGNVINRIAINTSGHDIINIATGDFDGGSDDIVVQTNDQVLFYQLNGTAGAQYPIVPASDIAVGHVDSEPFAKVFITEANRPRILVYDHDGIPINDFNINALDEHTSLSLATADINRDDIVEIIVGDLHTEDKVAIYDLKGTEIRTFSVFESSNTRQGTRKKDKQAAKANSSNNTSTSTPSSSDKTASSAPSSSNNTSSSAPSSSNNTSSSSPAASKHTDNSSASSNNAANSSASNNKTDSSPSPSSDNAPKSSASKDKPATSPASSNNNASSKPANNTGKSSPPPSSDNTAKKPQSNENNSQAGEHGKGCERGNASYCDDSTPSTPSPSDNTETASSNSSDDTSSSSTSNDDSTSSSTPSDDSTSSSTSSNDTESSSTSSDDTSSSSMSSNDSGSSTSTSSDDSTSSSPSSDDSANSSSSSDDSSSTSSDDTETSTSASSNDTETSTTSSPQPVTPPTSPTQPVTQPTSPSQPVTPEPIPEAPLPIPHGAKVATGDLDGDGIPEIIVGMANNGGTVEIYTVDGEKLSQFETGFEQGVEITAGDINQDGIDEIIVGDANGTAIQIFDLNGDLINEFQGSDNGNIASLAFGLALESPTTDTDEPLPDTTPTDQPSVTTPSEQPSTINTDQPSSETTQDTQSSETTPETHSSETAPETQSSETTPEPSTTESSDSTTVVSLPIVSLPPTTGSITQTGNYNGQTVTDAVIESNTSIANAKLEGDITNQGSLSNATILEGATLTGGTLTGYVNNQGTIADTQFTGAELNGGDLDGEITVTGDPDKGLGILKAVTVLPNALVTGGAVSGEIVNHGTLSDITINSDAIVTGGTLQGPIDNAGSLQNTILGEDTYINGGDLSGTVTGKADDIALIQNATIHDADLSYVQISEGTQLGPNVVIGKGVVFDDNALIPEGSDLTLALVSELPQPESVAINLETDVLAETQASTKTDNPPLLKQINTLPKMKANDWQLVQNPENGQLELTIEGVHFVLIPVQVTQVSADQPAGLTVYDDNSVSFVTGKGRKIFAQPVIQNKKALLEALAEISDDIIVEDDGTFKVKIKGEWKRYRVSLSSEPVNSEQALGLFENSDGSARLVFEDIAKPV